MITINGDGTDEALELLNQFGGKCVTFSIDEESGNISYNINLNKKGTPYKPNKQLQNLLGIIDDQSITVNILATASQYVLAGDEQIAFVGGAFCGNNIADDGHITATQVINPTDLKKIGDYTRTDPIIHEITEAYQGALISRKKGESSPRSELHGSVYKEAHRDAAYKQHFELKIFGFDRNGYITKLEYATKKEYRVYRNNNEYIIIRKVTNL